MLAPVLTFFCSTLNHRAGINTGPSDIIVKDCHYFCERLKDEIKLKKIF